MTSRPNILFIMMDQLRWDALGCTGGWVRTPYLDDVAARGIRFDNCVTAAPLCVPARVALATGLYPHCTGVWTNRAYTLSPESPTWMQAIRSAGYRTSLFGKTHLTPHQNVADLRDKEYLLHAYGLDDVDEIGGPHASTRLLSHMTARWKEKGLWDAYKGSLHRPAGSPRAARPSVLPLEEYADVYVGQQAKRYLHEYDRTEPWFCWVSFGGPHEPWDAPEPYASMYDPKDMPPPTSLRFDHPDRPQGYFDTIRRVQAKNPRPNFAELRSNYAGNVTLIDEQVGDILAEVEARGELDNTVVVLTADHGEMNGDYDILFKSNFLNGAVRIPLIISTPETRHSSIAGSRSAIPVELIDVGPTLVQLAGAEIDYPQFGRSLCSILVDLSHKHRTEAIAGFRGELMIFDGRWKLAVNKEGEAYLLFDLQNDPMEQRNLIGTAGARDPVARLRGRLLERLVYSLHYKEPYSNTQSQSL